MNIDLKNAQFVITDNRCTVDDGWDGIRHMIRVHIGEGNVTFTEKRTINYTKDFGRLFDVSEGDEDPVEVKFDLHWDYLSGQIAVLDALKQQGSGYAGTGWVSTDSDECRPPAVNIELLNMVTCMEAELIIFVQFRFDQLDYDLRNHTISITGRCNKKFAYSWRLTYETVKAGIIYGHNSTPYVARFFEVDSYGKDKYYIYDHTNTMVGQLRWDPIRSYFRMIFQNPYIVELDMINDNIIHPFQGYYYSGIHDGLCRVEDIVVSYYNPYDP